MSDIVMKGYVQKRRGVLTHLNERRLTINEYVVFDILLLLADKATGSYMINAPAVHFWTGQQMSVDAADRALRGLEKKDYIVREVSRGTLGLYPYHIQKFVVSSGAELGKVLTFTKKVNGIEKIEELLDAFGAAPAEDGAEHHADDTAKEPADAPAGDGAEETILETRDLRPETGNVATMPKASAAAPQPDSDQPKSHGDEAVNQSETPDPAVRLMRHFYKLLGTPAKHRGKGAAWTDLLRTLKAEPDRIQKVMDWAINDDPDWGFYITSSTKLDPLEYFVEKFDTIETQMEAQVKRLQKAKDKVKKVAAATTAKKETFGNKYEQGGTDFFAKFAKKDEAKP